MIETIITQNNYKPESFHVVRHGKVVIDFNRSQAFLFGEDNMIVYIATNKVNGKSYIGQTVFTLKKRKTKHIYDTLNDNSHCYFHRAIHKYGAKNFIWKILSTVENIDILNKLETFWIQYYNSFKNGYNSTSGGNNCIGLPCSKETRKKISKANKNPSKEIRQKISKSLKNHKVSKETRKEISKSLTGKKQSLETIKKRAKANKNPSEKTRKKMSIASKGRTMSMETRKKLSIAKQNISNETRKKLSIALKDKPRLLQRGKNNSAARAIIIQNQYFDTIRKASKILNIKEHTLSYRLRISKNFKNYQYAKL